MSQMKRKRESVQATTVKSRGSKRRCAKSSVSRHDQRQKVINVCSCVLEQLFGSRVDTLPVDLSKVSFFHSTNPPTVSISVYLQRIALYSDCSTEALVMGLFHINSLLTKKPDFDVNSLNIHRLLLASIMCSAKFFDDRFFDNASYAKIGGVSLRELNCLEVAFLALIGFDLFISPESYNVFYNYLFEQSLHKSCFCLGVPAREPIVGEPVFTVSDLTPSREMSTSTNFAAPVSQASATTFHPFAVAPVSGSPVVFAHAVPSTIVDQLLYQVAMTAVM